jgi:hypothetical protein
MDKGLSMLEHALCALRQAWPDEWPGLPTVVRSCLDYLGVDRSSRACVLRIDCLDRLARLVEADGAARARAGLELAYHNRLHIADTVVSLAALIRVQQEIESGARRGAGALQIEAMIAMVAHDYLHDGTVNRYRGELEARSCEAVDSELARLRLPAGARARIRRWIMATDPVVIARQHERIRGLAFSLAQPSCLQALINEADILVSSLPAFARSQTEALVRERTASGVRGAESLLSSDARRQFLARIALFSSDASRSLGLTRLRALQLETLGGDPAGA